MKPATYPTELQLLVYRKFLEQFIVFTEEEWSIFKTYLHLRKLRKKDFFVEAGNVCAEVGFILRGSIRYYHVKDGTEITGYFTLENDFVSAYKSFLTEIPSTAYIEALENTQLIVFNKRDLLSLEQDPRINLKMERFGRLVAEALICCYEDRVHSFVTQSPEERYLDLLKSGQDILKRIPQHYVANYLGITPVSLSRIRKRIIQPPIQLKTVQG
ncbi:Crp/Fnr family transcriptional regulator [Desertivirga xinjiangensis]|uniref:Crp/Fnr family transcriptional regulator n=1 Tax=Desertivirga xinjiangensis TaxID=539206 RepID=UPI00210EDDD0|nr:Crp/Fnr family transcriptional regulator [Pedobacter xinjiangensis]